jgi:hypothetical protein
MIILLWLATAALVGAIASNKGRSGIGWFILAVLFSPLLAGIILAIVLLATPKREAEYLRNRNR